MKTGQHQFSEVDLIINVDINISLKTYFYFECKTQSMISNLRLLPFQWKLSCEKRDVHQSGSQTAYFCWCSGTKRTLEEAGARPVNQISTGESIVFISFLKHYFKPLFSSGREVSCVWYKCQNYTDQQPCIALVWIKWLHPFWKCVPQVPYTPSQKKLNSEQFNQHVYS